MPEPPKDRPRWSITWLLKVQRVGRDRRERYADRRRDDSLGFRWFMWLVVALLAVEVAVGLWQGWLPRG